MGFAAGADDYVCKPFNPQELMARVKAILRRSQPPGEAAPLCYEDIALVLSEHSAFVGGIKIQLTQIEFKLLSMFVEQPNKVFLLAKSCFYPAMVNTPNPTSARSIFILKICVKNKCAVNWPLYSNRVRLGV